MSWITSEEALALLKVQPQTLYANVSRGRIRTRPHPQDVRRSLYHGEDIKKLAERHAGRRSAADVAAQTISFGEPVLASALSTIADGRLWYRGEDAARLSERAGLEEIARLLWQVGRVDLAFPPTVKGAPIPANPFEAALLALARRASHDFPTGGRSHAVLCREAAGLVGTVAAAMLGGGSDGALPLHQQAARAWQAPNAAGLIRRALVLLADHELNASTFAARVTAGTLAGMYAAITSAIGALSGPLHGGANEQVMRMLLKIGEPSQTETYLEGALARKERIMGFGHRVYKTEDPRATHLRKMSEELGQRTGDSRWYEMSRRIEAYIKQHKGLNANVDFYSASTYYMMDIPIDLDTPIFACSRITGWTSHVLEQYDNNRLIRPRAEYVGPHYPAKYTPLAQR